jgi:hypothetical protein
MSRILSKVSMSVLAAVCAIPVIATMLTGVVALIVMPPICEFREGDLGDYNACMSPYHTALAVSAGVLLIVVILLTAAARRRGARCDDHATNCSAAEHSAR